MTPIVTPNAIASFPNLFKPRKNEMNGQEEYSITLLFPKGTDLSKLEALAKAAAVKKWGEDKTKWPTNLRNPIRSQSEKKKEGAMPPGHEEGAFFINLKSKAQPKVVDRNVQLILDESQIYAGCIVKASITAYAYDQKGNRGVSFGLQHVQKVADGEALAGRIPVEQSFAPIADEEGSKPQTAADLFS